jgi:hypothetical protein
MAKRMVDTTYYAWSHGHKPRTHPGTTGQWAFRLDGQEQIVKIYGEYRLALVAAKRQAQHSVQVLS